jgi:lipopolysaccharide transport system permease protein
MTDMPASRLLGDPLIATDTGEANLPVTKIRPSKGLLDLDLMEVWDYRELLFLLTMRDIQILYKQAMLGAAWAIIQPVLAVTIFAVVFGHFAKMPSNGAPYPLFAFAAILPWTYFAEAVRRGATGIVNDAELVRKVYFPRLLMPLAGVLAPLLDFALAFLVLLGLMLWYGIAPGWEIVLVLPLILLAGLLALAIGLWLAPVNVRFRDVKYTVPFLLQIWMYASPIVYPLSLVPEKWKWLYSLNPMVGIIEGFRWAIIPGGSLEVRAIAISTVFIAALLLSGLIFFRHMERTFADKI